MKLLKFDYRGNGNISPRTILLSRDGEQILSRGSLMMVKGVSGSGKSSFVQSLLYGWLGLSDGGLGFSYLPDCRIAALYTEMGSSDLDVRWSSIIKSEGHSLLQDRLSLHYLGKGSSAKLGVSRDSYNMMYEILEEQLMPLLKGVDIIVLDQVGDFHYSVNDEEWWSFFVEALNGLASSYNVGIVIVIHQNEGSSAFTKARGHAGSILEQKVKYSLSISRYGKDKFKLSATKSSYGTLSSWIVAYDSDRRCFIADIEETETEELSKIDLSFLDGGKSYNEASVILSAQESLSARMAKVTLSKLLDAKLIVKERKGKQVYYYRVSSSVD